MSKPAGLYCTGALAVFSGLLCFRMSLYRLKGSPGESDPKSDLNKWHLAQTLNQEWNATLLPLFIAAHLSNLKCPTVNAAIIAVSASRVTFVIAKVFDTNSLRLAFPSMLTTYLGTFYIGAKVVQAAL
eukprot:PhF_6_TR7197/c0_g1_i1/m.10759